MRRKKIVDFFKKDLEEYMALPLKRKLVVLEDMNRFFQKIVPKKNDEIWKKLKQEGF